MGAQIETTDGHLPLDDHGRRRCSAIDYELPVASAQVKSACCSPGSARRAGRPYRAGADARPHRADAARGRRARRRARPSVGQRRPGRAARASARSTCPGDFSSAAPFIVAATLAARARGSRSTTSASTRAAPASSTCSSGWARASAILNRRRIGRRAGRRPRGALGRADRDDDRAPTRCRCSSTSCRSSRCSPRMRARRRAAVDGAEELRAKETDRIEARRRRAARDRRPRQGACRTASPSRGVPTRPRGGTIDARGDHRIAMLGAVAGARLARGRARSRAPRASAISFPGFFDLLESGDADDDRRHRRPRRGRQEHRRAQARGAARLPLPRHRRDVPRAHLARAARGAAARRRASRSASSRARTRSPSTRRGRVFIAGTDVTAAIRQSRDRPDGAGRRAPPRGARGDARAAARARPRRATS